MSGKVFGIEAQPIDAELAPHIQNAIMAEIHAEYDRLVDIEYRHLELLMSRK
jgi:hypothetical protein